jgi:hypothetical protein
MNRAKFFDTIRHSLFDDKLKPDQVIGIEALLGEFETARWPLSHAAYGFATAYHETARTMQPIAEYGRGRGKQYGKPDPKTGKVYYGRGYVQLTWYFNYAKAEKELGYGLVHNPDLAMRPDIAAAVLVKGMAEGWFTSRANKHFLNKEPPDYVGARKIINGTDKAELIAGYARKFAVALQAAGYSLIPQDSTGTEVVSATITLASGAAKIRTQPEAPQSYRLDGKHETPASERSWWSRVVNKLLAKEP